MFPTLAGRSPPRRIRVVPRPGPGTRTFSVIVESTTPTAASASGLFARATVSRPAPPSGGERAPPPRQVKNEAPRPVHPPSGARHPPPVMVGVLVVFGITAYPRIGVDLMPTSSSLRDHNRGLPGGGSRRPSRSRVLRQAGGGGLHDQRDQDDPVHGHGERGLRGDSSRAGGARRTRPSRTCATRWPAPWRSLPKGPRAAVIEKFDVNAAPHHDALR